MEASNGMSFLRAIVRIEFTTDRTHNHETDPAHCCRYRHAAAPTSGTPCKFLSHTAQDAFVTLQSKSNQSPSRAPLGKTMLLPLPANAARGASLSNT